MASNDDRESREWADDMRRAKLHEEAERQRRDAERRAEEERRRQERDKK